MGLTATAAVCRIILTPRGPDHPLSFQISALRREQTPLEATRTHFDRSDHPGDLAFGSGEAARRVATITGLETTLAPGPEPT